MYSLFSVLFSLNFFLECFECHFDINVKSTWLDGWWSDLHVHLRIRINVTITPCLCNFVCCLLVHYFFPHHTGSGAVCLCHFDSCGIETGCKKMLGLVKELSKDKLPGRYVQCTMEWKHHQFICIAKCKLHFTWP